MQERANGDEQPPAATATAWLIGLMTGGVLLALLGGAYLIGFNRGEDKGRGERPVAAQPATETTTAPAAAGPGREIFAQTCGTCHTLSAADTSGTVGPNLDDLQPDQAQVEAAIQNGGSGSGAMPSGLLQGAEAQQVAAFVAQSAGG